MLRRRTGTHERLPRVTVTRNGLFGSRRWHAERVGARGADGLSPTWNGYGWTKSRALADLRRKTPITVILADDLSRSIQAAASRLRGAS